MLMLRQKQDFIGTASGSKMKRPREAFCYQIPLTLPVVTFIPAEGMVPKSDFTSESARRHHWRCNRRKRGGRRQTSMLTVAWKKGKWMREKENGLVSLPKPSLKLLSRWGRWGQTHTFQEVLYWQFPCQMGKTKSSYQMTAKSALVFPPVPSSCLKQMRKCKSSWAGSTLLLPWASQRWTNLISLCLSLCPVSLHCCCLKKKLLGPGAILLYVWKVCKEWEPPNLYLHVSIIMLIISSWPEPTSSRLTRKFCYLQSWVQTGDLSEGLVFQV